MTILFPTTHDQAIFYRNVMKDFARPTRDLFVYKLYRKRPYFRVQDVGYHTKELMKLVLLRLRDADKDKYPPKGIYTILDNVVAEYIDGLI